MHDDTRPGSWSNAFAALPQETPPAQAWERVSAQLDRRRRNRVPAWAGFAAAAALVLAVIPWEPAPVEPSQARPTETKPVEPSHARPTETHPVEPSHARLTEAPSKPKPEPEPSVARLYTLYAESAQLEALLAFARDDRVASAGAALLADELEARIAAIDASLAQPGLDDAGRERLWQARVDALRQAAGFESTQRLLASQGYTDVLLVSVD